MGKKKPFVNRKKASTYHLLHRSQRDIGEEVLLEEGEVAGAGMVLWPAPENSQETNSKILVGGGPEATKMSEWRSKLASAGLLQEDPNRYLKPISGRGTFLDSTGHVASAGVEHALGGVSEAADDGLIEVDRQFDSISLTMDYMDEDIAAALKGDFDEGEFEELNDDFILAAATEAEGGQADIFDFDDHIQQLVEKAKLERNEPASDYGRHEQGHQDLLFFSGLRAVHEKDEDDDSFANGAVEEGTLATIPGVVSALNPAEERALCEKFEEALLQYDSDDMGDCADEEIHGTRDIEGDDFLESALDEFLETKDDDILISGVQSARSGGSSYAALIGTKMVPAKDLEEYETEPIESIEKTLRDADERLLAPHEKPPTDEILIDGKSYFSERERSPFDCESILSTYSNLDNNPATIVSSRRRRRNNHKAVAPVEPVQQIELSKKTGLPLGVLPTRIRSEDDEDCGETYVSVNKGVARSKKETQEEKKARKAAVKMERQMARIQKKVAREVFAEEFEKRNVDIATNDIAGKTVFRYS